MSMILPSSPSNSTPIQSSPSESSLSPAVHGELELPRSLIPSCERCRRLRRKCDTNLPSCTLCAKAKAECEFYDHVLQQVLPRSYIQSLLERRDALRVIKKAQVQALRIHRPAALASDTITATPTTTNSLLSPSAISGQADLSKRSESEMTPSLSQPSDTLRLGFDRHFFLPNTKSNSQFFGSSSPFSLAVEVLAHAYNSPCQVPLLPVSLENHLRERLDPSASLEGYSVHIPKPPDTKKNAINLRRDTIWSLLTIYRASLNTIYPFFLESTLPSDLEAYFTIIERKEFNASHLAGTEAFQYFRLTMMCAITCTNKSRYQPSLIGLEESFYNEALKCVEEVTSEVSPESLQALLLLIQYCLFHPRKGDIWKLLDFACRLSVELGFHTEEESKWTKDDNEKKELRRNTFWGLYAIERIVGQLFGRPSDLPESIITTEYPSVLAMVTPQDQDSAQVVSAAHHYRLVYLRSEIYREIYLPSTMPYHELNWFKERYFLLSHWYKEVESSLQHAGVGTITCTVAYHSTIIFLFQPLMLQALSGTHGSNSTLAPTTPKCIPSDNYWSAVQLIKTYEKVIQAPDDSAVGIYPMTFMSAHYVCLAALTLMAHGLLSIDGRIPAQCFLDENTAGFPEKIEYGSVHEVSASCLILLSWCAEKFPGLEGMLEMYKRLSEKVLPELLRRGL